MTRRSALVLAAAALLWPAAASARSYTPDLSAFYRCSPGSSGLSECAVDVDAFRSFAAEMGFALAPKLVGPAGTLGSAGFEVSFGTGLTDFNGEADYWAGNASKSFRPPTQDPGSLLITNQIRFRKGLPYSFQVGGIVSHLHDSDLWGIGLELGWALAEGWKWAPDLGLNASVNTLLGADDLAMLEVSLSALLSKSFSIVGLFTLEPYAGYSLLYVNASSHLTAVAPTLFDGTDPSTGRSGSQVVQFAIGQQHVFRHRGVVGLNAVMSWVSAGFEATIGADQRTYAFKLGLQF